MGDHPLLPPIQHAYKKGDAEAQVLAIGRRFPALCKLLATLVTASPPKAQDAEVSFLHGVNFVFCASYHIHAILNCACSGTSIFNSES